MQVGNAQGLHQKVTVWVSVKTVSYTNLTMCEADQATSKT